MSTAADNPSAAAVDGRCVTGCPMRDPMSWAIPVFRAFGIPVKVHLFFFIFTLGLFLRQVGDARTTRSGGWTSSCFTVVVLFGIVLLHEFGHCFGARHVGGDAKEILIWPLGGLAYVDVPHNPRAHFITVAAGPGVNVVICLVCAIGMAGAGYLPNLNPLREPVPRRDQQLPDEARTSSSRYGTRRGGYAEVLASSDLPRDMAEYRHTRRSIAEQLAAKPGCDRDAGPARRRLGLPHLLPELVAVPVQPDPGLPARRRADAAVGGLGAARLPPGGGRRGLHRVRRRGRVPDRVDRVERGAVHGAGAVHALRVVDDAVSPGDGGRAVRVRLLGGVHEPGEGRGAAAEAEARRLVQALAAGPDRPARSSARPRSAPATRSAWTSSSRRSPGSGRSR